MASTKRKSGKGNEDKTDSFLDHNAPIVSQEAASEQHRDDHRPKRIKVMSSSGQTNAERRDLRQKLRQMHADILSGAAAYPEEGDEQSKSAFDCMRTKNNRLWDKVHYHTEAVLEIKNVKAISEHTLRETESIVVIPRYDAHRLAAALKKKATVRNPSGKCHFGWKEFGCQAGICFNSLPSHVSFLYGPLDSEYTAKERKKTEKLKRQTAADDESEEELLDVDQSHKNKKKTGNELSAVNDHMKVIYQTLRTRSKEEMEGARLLEKEYIANLEHEIIDCNPDKAMKRIEAKTKQFRIESQKVDAVQALFNPQSFTQTVENLSHLSFLVKENRAAIEVRSAERARELGLGGPGPVIRPLHYTEDPPPPRQAILSLNMKVSLSITSFACTTQYVVVSL